ncbi:MAG: hypothetical protein JSW62_04670 [Thermoplasmatales archaeon]|nr:MAG: hypothetical protein JSW62_04670 [Thermoplasmatales archaeon]
MKNPDLVYDLFVTYENSFDGTETAKILFALKRFNPDGPPERIIGHKESMDEIIKVFNELFPNPYCA